MRKTFKKIGAVVAASVMAMTLTVTAAPDTAKAGVKCSEAGEAAGKAEFDPAGTYHAYFGFQQADSWIFRDAWYNPESGLDGASWVGDASFDKVVTTLNVNDAIPSDGTITDVEIKGNGTYTVGVSGLNGTLQTNPDAQVKLLFVSTDIPSTALDTIQITDIKYAIDGIEQDVAEPYVNLDAKEWGLYQFDIVNLYQSAGYTSPTIMSPSDSMTITFTVSGMANDNPEAVPATPEPAATESAESAESEGEGSGIDPIVIAVVAGVVVVIAVVAVVATKKKKK